MERMEMETQVRTERKGRVPARRKRENGVLMDLLYLLIKIAVIVLAFLLLFTFMFGILRYDDLSMWPHVKNGDVVIYYRLDKSYVASDTLILKYKGETQMRRVIAVAGDEVSVDEEGLYINGARQNEKNIYTKTQRFETGVEFPLQVREGQVFVLGDNRETATDSRMYGLVNIEDTLGKVMTVIRIRGI